MKKVSVVIFPGTNCDHDVAYLYRDLLKAEVRTVWHKDRDLGQPDLVVVPGGFSYGDYLRTGALAKLSPVMESVREFAARGRPVLGICNGFQILCEAGLLPGVLLQNRSMRFLSRFVNLRVEESDTPFTSKLSVGAVVTCPIAHFEGNYFADEATIAEMRRNRQIIFRYCAADGTVDPANTESNPNGSIESIAGICNRQRNVVGMMPHPERAAEALVGGIGGDSGLAVFTA